MSDRQLAKARKRFGLNAVAFRRKSGRFDPGQGSLSGKCSTCYKLDCRRKWQYTIGVVEGGLFVLVKGRGHSWKEAWARVKD